MIDADGRRALFLVVLMIGSVATVGVGGVAAQSASGEAPTQASADAAGGELALGSGPAVEATRSTDVNQTGEVQIAHGLRNRTGETVLLVGVERSLNRGAIDYADVDTETLKADSELTLSPVKQQVETLKSTSIRQSFWVGNTISVSVDLNETSAEEIAAIDGVKFVMPNVEATIPTPPASDSGGGADVEAANDYTYGLQQIDVPGFEQKYGDHGGNASVAIIDDGISRPTEGHPDLDFWKTATAANGNITPGTLGSPGSHGEHVAGTATGAATPAGDVPRYGVAPNASLLMINAFEGGAAFEDVLASVQHSISQDVDVASMSLGFSSTTGNSVVIGAMENTIQDANAAGTLVVGSAGNSGNGDAGGPTTSPGAEFSVLSVGASGPQGGIGSFSSGDMIAPYAIEMRDENASYPQHYPREYVNPDVSAPGVSVLSAGPVGTVTETDPTYSVTQGTSMAAPHVAGATALLQSVTEEDLDPKTIEAALTETAEKPSNDHLSRHGRDIRYGTGIINVTAAADALKDGTTDVSGTVTDTDDNPIPGASVVTDDGALTSTNGTGEYTLHTSAQSTAVTVDRFGYEASTETVNENGTYDVQLVDKLAVDLLTDQDAYAAFGGQVNATVDVRNLDNVTVSLTEATNVSQEHLTLLVNGEEATFGEPVDLGSYDGTAEITVEIADSDDLSEGQVVGLEHMFQGLGENTTVETGPSTLTQEVAPAFFELSNLTTPDTLTVGNPLTASVNVTNTGEEAATKDIQHVLSGNLGNASLPANSLTLAPGETTTFSVAADGVGGLYSPGQVIEVGFRTADSISDGSVTGLDDREMGPVALRSSGAVVNVENIDAPASAPSGGEIDVSATVRNVGSQPAEEEVRFTLQGETIATRTVNLSAYDGSEDGTATVEFENVTLPESNGVLKLEVSAGGDTANTGVEVGDAEYDTVTVVESDSFFEPGQGEETVSVFEDQIAVNFETQVVDASEVTDEVIRETDVFVVHDLYTASDPGKVMDAIESDQSSGVVYLEQAIASNALSARAQETGDPVNTSSRYGGSGPAMMEISSTHPIFDGVGAPGDSVPIHTSSHAAISWFNGADGETLARAGDGQGTAGPAVTIDPGSGSVFVSSIAPTAFPFGSDTPTIPPQQFTPEAGQILANSIEFAKPTGSVGSTSINAEFVGTVNDAEPITVSADGLTNDGEVVDGETVTFTVGDEPVATTTVQDGSASTTFDPATLDASAGQTLSVGVEEYTAFDEDTVETVHETADLQDGFNLLSVPQAANLSMDGVNAVNTWNATTESYETLTRSQLDSTGDLNTGMYVSAEDDSARAGFTFSDEIPSVSTARIDSDWTLTGSNFAIDNAADGDTRTIDEDLVGVDAGQLRAFGPDFAEYDGSTTVGAFDGYWVYSNATSHDRGIVSPSYDIEGREDVLGLNDSQFDVTIDSVETGQNLSTMATDEALARDSRAISVTATVTNTGGHDVQFADLEVDAGDGTFERVDRSTGLSLASGESETVTLTYVPDRSDAPGVDLRVTTADNESAVENVTLDTNAITVADQALTLSGDLIVKQVNASANSTLEVVSAGAVVGSTELTAGTSENVTVAINESAVSGNEVAVRLADGGDDRGTRVLVELTEPTVAVSADAPDSATANGSVDVNVTVENNALVEQNSEIAFSVDNESVGSKNVTLAGGNDTTVTFTASTDGLSDNDTLSYTVESADDSESGEIGIEAAPSDPANFGVSIDSANDSVTANEEIVVSYTVENTGDAEGTQTVGFDVNGTDAGSQEHTLAAGANASGTFTYTTSGDDTPEVTATVASANDSAQRTVGVSEAASATGSFNASIDSVNDSVTAGEEITVSYTVENTADAEATQNVTLTVNDTQKAEKTDVTLASNETTSGTFTYTTSNDDTPEVTVQVAVSGEGSNSATQAVTVAEQSD